MIGNQRNLILNSKNKSYNSNVKSVPLYGAECWRPVKTEKYQLNTFHNSCLKELAKYFGQTKYQRMNCMHAVSAIVLNQKRKTKD